MSTRVVLHGELHVELVEIARWYEVEVTVLEDVCAEGVVGPLRTVDGRHLLPASAFDRLAVAVRFVRFFDVAPRDLPMWID